MARYWKCPDKTFSIFAFYFCILLRIALAIASLVAGRHFFVHSDEKISSYVKKK